MFGVLYDVAMRASKGKVLVAMSGGVDSSVAAALLKDDGYEVVGCFMRLGSPGESLEQDEDDQACSVDSSKKAKIGHQGCCSINDAKDAQLVAANLDIPFYVLNFKRDFGRIIDYFVSEYNAGRTPNPCVRCNDWLKFGKLADYARSIDADYVATGHYARVEEVDGERALLRGVDLSKDQSYVLFGSQREHLRHMMLPIGGYEKPEIRKIASEIGLLVSNKPDSQEICFVPTGDYKDVLRERSPASIEPGEIRHVNGDVLGRHGGHQNYTIGQRRGVGVAVGEPIYVVDKNPADNSVIVGSKQDLACSQLTALQTNWLVSYQDGESIECQAKIRYNANPVPAIVTPTGEDQMIVQFDTPQFAVAPGQAVVCYDGDRVLCGGWISKS